jgi:hypothetical protein
MASKNSISGLFLTRNKKEQRSPNVFAALGVTTPPYTASYDRQKQRNTEKVKTKREDKEVEIIVVLAVGEGGGSQFQ